MPSPNHAALTPHRHVAAKLPEKFVQHTSDSPFSDPFGDRNGSNPTSPNARGADPAYPTLDSSGPGLSAIGERPLTLAEELGTHAPDLDYECPSVDELKPIGKITYRTEPQPGELPRNCEIKEQVFQPRLWAETTVFWKASGLCHKPLYFEDVHLERYGHSWGPFVQPVMSGAHFFGNTLLLPYKMGMYPPHECMYTLGYYRPGSCAPYMLDPIPISVRGALVAAGAWVGGVYIIP